MYIRKHQSSFFLTLLPNDNCQHDYTIRIFLLILDIYRKINKIRLNNSFRGHVLAICQYSIFQYKTASICFSCITASCLPCHKFTQPPHRRSFQTQINFQQLSVPQNNTLTMGKTSLVDKLKVSIHLSKHFKIYTIPPYITINLKATSVLAGQRFLHYQHRVQLFASNTGWNSQCCGDYNLLYSSLGPKNNSMRTAVKIDHLFYVARYTWKKFSL